MVPNPLSAQAGSRAVGRPILAGCVGVLTLTVLTLTVLTACGAGGEPADAVIAQDVAASSTLEPASTPTVPPELRDRTPAEIDRIRRQELVDEALRPAEAASLGGVPGFAALAIAGHMAGRIWWKNPPPEITAMDGTTKAGVTLTVVRVAFSETDLITAMNRASSSLSKDLPQIVQARPNDAYEGIELGFLPEIYEQIDKQDVAERYEEIVDMPVALYETQGSTRR